MMTEATNVRVGDRTVLRKADVRSGRTDTNTAKDHLSALWSLFLGDILIFGGESENKFEPCPRFLAHRARFGLNALADPRRSVQIFL